MPHNNLYDHFGADGVPTLQGPQGIGKTSTIQGIIPKSLLNLFKDGVSIDTHDKDTIMQATSLWIGELGELDGITKKEQQGLKAFITAAADQYRTPYARKKVKRPRRTAFWGTVNPDQYLTDATGNRRFWTIPVKNINLERLFSLSEEWKLQLWAQLYHDYKENPQGFRLTPDERRWLESVNQRFAKPLKYELEIRALLDYDLPVTEWETFYPGDLARCITGLGVTAEQVGSVLSKLAREDPRIVSQHTNKGTAYHLPRKKWQSTA